MEAAYIMSNKIDSEKLVVFYIVFYCYIHFLIATLQKISLIIELCFQSMTFLA